MVLETPKFWTKMRLRVDNGNVSEVMKSKIIKLVSGIEWYDVSQKKKNLRIIERLIRAVVNNELSQLKTVLFQYQFRYDLSSISPELVSQAVVRLEECDLLGSKLSTDQARAILDKIIDTEDLKLKRFFVGRGNLREIPADLIMKASIKLEDTNVYSSLDSGLDWIKFVAESPIIKLKSLFTNDMVSCHHGVPPDVLAAALVRVENVDDVTEPR